MMNPAPLKLYLATDPELGGNRDLPTLVEEAVAAGVTIVQLRDKKAEGGTLYATAARLRELTARLGVPLIINDRVDVMLAVEADGVHVGTNDLPLEHVRRLAGDRIVGYSVNTIADLRTAERYGADYIGIGPVFPTATKPDAHDVLGAEGLKTLLEHTRLPAVSIGGITPRNCSAVIEAGAVGVCAISAILGADSIARAVEVFRTALKTAV